MDIELFLGEYGFVDDHYHFFAQYDYLVASGDTLDEILNDASVTLTDQDGGEVTTCSIYETQFDNELESLVTFEYNKKKGLNVLKAVK